MHDFPNSAYGIKLGEFMIKGRVEDDSHENYCTVPRLNKFLSWHKHIKPMAGTGIDQQDTSEALFSPSDALNIERAHGGSIYLFKGHENFEI